MFAIIIIKKPFLMIPVGVSMCDAGHERMCSSGSERNV